METGPLFIMIFGIYFLPTIIAIARKTNNRNQVILIDLLLGWSIVGWIVALIMSVGDANKKKEG